MQRIFPKKLKKNDTIGLLAIAGSIENADLINKAAKYFTDKGYKVKISPNAYECYRYLSGTDKARTNAINDFFADKEIDAIIALRGGYGSIRIINDLDYETIKSNPKIFAGYSDITALSLMIYKKTGLITYNAPMACSDFAKNIDKYTEESFFDMIENNINIITLNEPLIYKNGISEGILWGGNLSTIQSLCGLDFIPQEHFIFIAEDVNEPVYKIDKMFTQLFNIPKFKNNVQAIVLGDFTNIDNKDYFDELFQEIAKKYSIPIISGLKFGHEKQKTTFPIGIKAELDTDKALIKLL